jgi:hypothetical protein
LIVGAKELETVLEKSFFSAGDQFSCWYVRGSGISRFDFISCSAKFRRLCESGFFFGFREWTLQSKGK